MSYQVAKSSAHSVPVKLVRDDDFKTAVTGKTGANVTVRYKKYPASDWSTKDVSGSGWDEIGNGFYEVDFSGSDMDVLGRFDYQVECAGCLDYNGAVLVVEHDPARTLDTLYHVLVRAAGTVQSPVEANTVSSVAAVGFTGYPYEAGILGPGDLLCWRGSSDDALGLLTRVVAFDGATLQWSPELPAAPAFGAVFYVLPRFLADHHRAVANVGYDGVTLTVNAWLERRGELAPNPSSCTVTVYDDAGAQQFSLTDAAPDAQGVFRMTKTSPGLAAGKSYYAKVAVAAGGATYLTIEGVATL